MNTQIKSTQSQLKDVEKLLKLDPGNTELITQKQKLLADAVKETKDKLETLKTAAWLKKLTAFKQLVKDTSYGGLWEVSFSVKEF
jgi:hypothetical protein